MVALEEQKLAFIRQVSEIEDEKTLTALVEAYRQITRQTKTVDSRPGKAIRQKFDAETIRLNRGRVGHDKAKIMRLIKEMDIQEPVEQLLAQLTK